MTPTQTSSFAFELKALNAREFEGHGSVFRNVDLGGDVVVPGAFKRTLAKHKAAGTMPLMYWMHQPDQVPGVWHEMAEDKEGLYVRGELVDTQLGNDMRTLLSKKAVRGLSIGYRTVDSEFEEDGTRRLKEVELWEVSIVSMAMNPLAKVEAVKARLSRDGVYVPTEREFEMFLRRNGYSRKFAEHVVAKVFDGTVLQGEPAEPRGDPGDAEARAVLEAIQALTASVGAAVALSGR